MGIENIHLLKPDDDSRATQVRERKVVSRHVVTNSKATKKWVFGWDQPLQSFYLQVHDLTLPEDDRIVVWLGADKDTIMYEVEDLARAAAKHGLGLDRTHRMALYGEKDDGV